MDRIAMLKEILESSPEDAFARYGLALEIAKTGDVDGALAEFKNILEKNPDYVPAYQMGAQTLMEAGRHEEARALLEKGVEVATRTRNGHALSEMEMMLQD